MRIDRIWRDKPVDCCGGVRPGAARGESLVRAEARQRSPAPTARLDGFYYFIFHVAILWLLRLLLLNTTLPFLTVFTPDITAPVRFASSVLLSLS